MAHHPESEKMANIVLAVYTYALENYIDINNPEDVKKALKALDIELPPDVSIAVLMVGLVEFHKIAKDTTIKSEKKKLLN
jgi:hypothetical protein